MDGPKLLADLRACLREQKEIVDREGARPGNTFLQFDTEADRIRFNELLGIQLTLLKTIRDSE